jgi:diguanylate cyclase (GGDEF)-like protein
VAAGLVRCFPRRSDCVARFGGDEMAVLLADAGLADGLRLADRLLDQVRRMPVRTDDGQHEMRLTQSVGVAALADGESPEKWFSRADAALYKAKQAGRDRAASA